MEERPLKHATDIKQPILPIISPKRLHDSKERLDCYSQDRESLQPSAKQDLLKKHDGL